ncbi:uncharacterized protein LOC144433013 [Glandiceps talaboti]
MSKLNLESLRARLDNIKPSKQMQEKDKDKDDTSHGNTGTVTLEFTDHTSWLNKIIECGNKPENWLEFLNYVEFRRNYQDKQTRYQYLYSVFSKAIQQMSLDENKKNLNYAKIHIRFALLQGEDDVEDGRMQFQYARANLRTIALVHVAAAQYELEHDNVPKSKSIMRKAKEVEAEPTELLNQAMRKLINGEKQIYGAEEHGIKPSHHTSRISELGHYRHRSWVNSGSNSSGGSNSSKNSSEVVCISYFSLNSSSASSSSLSDHHHSTHMTIDGTVSFKTTDRSHSTVEKSAGSDADTIPMQFPHTAQKSDSRRKEHAYQFSQSAKKSVRGPVFTPDTKLLPSVTSASAGPVRVPRTNSKFGGPVRFARIGLPKVYEYKGPDEDDDDDDYDILHGVKPLDETDGPGKVTGHSPDDKTGEKSASMDMISRTSTGMRLNAKERKESMTSTVDRLRTKSVIQNFERDQVKSRSSIAQGSNMVTSESLPDKMETNKAVPEVLSSVNSRKARNITSSGLNTPYSSKPLLRQSAVSSVTEVSQDNKTVTSQDSKTVTSQDRPTVVTTTPKPPRLLSIFNMDSEEEEQQQHKQQQVHEPMDVEMADVDTVKAKPQQIPATLPQQQQQQQPLPMNLPQTLQTSQAAVQYSQNPPSVMGYQQMMQQPCQFQQPTFPPQQPMMPPQGYATPQPGLPVTQEMMAMQAPIAAKKDVIVVNGRSYNILRVIGRGGSSKVYQVFDESKKKLYAIKQVNLECADEMTVQGYINEINLLQKLMKSERIIHLYDCQVTDTHIYMIQECGSIDLASFLRKAKKQKAIKNEDIKHYWRHMLEAVECVHKEGIIHSDLKPANFLFVDATLKLIDFGIANAIQQDKTSVIRESQVGTLNYMSPEAIQDTSATPNFDDRGHRRPRLKIGCKSDVWSLGCILYYIVYGKTPFQHISNHFAKLQAICDPNCVIEFPQHENKLVIDVLQKCLRRNPKERPSIQELLNHPYLQAPPSAMNVMNVELQFKNLLTQLTPHSPNSINLMTRSLIAQMQTGGNVDMSAMLSNKTSQATTMGPPIPPPNFSLPPKSIQHQPMMTHPQPHISSQVPRSTPSQRQPLGMVSMQEFGQVQNVQPNPESVCNKYTRNTVDRENDGMHSEPGVFPQH